MDWGAVEREEKANKISYESGAMVDVCTVSCQAAHFSHGDALPYAEGHEYQRRTADVTPPILYFDTTRCTQIKGSNDVRS